MSKIVCISSTTLSRWASLFKTDENALPPKSKSLGLSNNSSSFQIILKFNEWFQLEKTTLGQDPSSGKVLLSTSTTKQAWFNEFRDYCVKSGTEPDDVISKTTFLSWIDQLGGVTQAKKYTDVCPLCYLMESRGESDLTAHLTDADVLYWIQHCGETVAARKRINEIMENLEPRQLGVMIDYAAAFQLPYLTKQPGPLNFASNMTIAFLDIVECSRKVAILSEEQFEVKSASGVISLLEKYFAEIDLENQYDSIVFAWDNCTSQFKNNSIMRWLASLVLEDRIESVKWLFFWECHGKNACDGFFGHCKKKFWARDNVCMEDCKTAIRLASEGALIMEVNECDMKEYDSVLQERIFGPKIYQIKQGHEFTFTKGTVDTCKVTIQDSYLKWGKRKHLYKLVNGGLGLAAPSAKRYPISSKKSGLIRKMVLPVLPEPLKTKFLADLDRNCASSSSTVEEEEG